MNLADWCFQGCPFGIIHTQILLYDLTQKLYVFFSDLQEFCQTWGKFLGSSTVFQLSEN